MYKQSDAALAAWRATERTLDGKVTITDSSGNETNYGTSDITSIAYDSGAWTGDTFSIGSTYENNITVTFAHLVEGLKQGYKVTAKIGIKLPDGTYEYCPLGVFIISDEITMDRNNDATTIKAYDQFCAMQGTYTSKLTYPAKTTDVIAEIANMSGVELNTDDIAELPTQTDLASAISGQTYCTAIGWIAQFYGGFALFDRDGKLTIRTVTDASYILDASQYEQSGLTKNEATYKIGGMSVSVTTTTTDSTGESSETTSTLTAGSTSGSQIELTNNVMTRARLDSIWSAIKDITFYPYSLTWFGNPAIEAGDWLTLKDTAGNSFNVPNNSYTMTFDGGLTATSKADQTSTSSSSYSYSGTLSQTVKQLAGRIGATGNYIYGTDTAEEPTTAKIGDLWYKQNGNQVEMWQYVRQSDGTGKWELIASDVTGEGIKANVDKAMAEADTAKQNANTAVETGNQALTKAQAGIDTANSAADNANTAMSNSSTAINNAKSAMTDAANAINTANNSSDIANAVQQQVTTLKDGSTMTIADLENGLALKLVKSDLNGYATQSWASSQITATANGLQSQVASVKSTADKATADITTLNQRADGWDSTISSLSTNKADQTWTTNQIKASADSLNVNISKVQTQVNNSAVGTNLFVNTGANSSTYPYVSLPSSQVSVNGIINSDNTGIIKITAPSNSEFYFRFSDPSTSTNKMYNLIAGETYTISGYANLTDGQLKFRVQTVNGSGGWNDFAGSISSDLGVTDSDGTTFTKFSYTFTIPSVATGIYLSLQAYNFTDGKSILSLKQMKLERGSIATDWSANPADNATVTSVTNLSITLDGIKQTVAKKVDNDTFASYQTQTATLIGSKVASNDFNSYKAQTDNALSQRVTSALFNSYQTQTDKAIQQRVTSATYNAEVTTLSNQINSKVSQPDWANSAVGANLVPNSNADTSGIAYGYNTVLGKHSFYNGGNSYLNIIHNTSTSELTSASARFYITAGETYTLSFKAFNNGLLTSADVWLLGRSNSNTTDGYTVAQELVNGVKFSTAAVQYYTVTFKVQSGIENAYLRFDNNGTTKSGSSADLYFNEVKIEKGSIATPWCPAASEIANYSQIQQLSNNINLRVVKNDVINQINVSTESILIAGEKVHITGQTTIDNAVIKSAMVDTLSASKITFGILNGSLVNVTNINADNITAGTLTGVSFHQSSSGHDTWIDGNGIHDYDGSGNNAWIQKGRLQVYDKDGDGFFMDSGKLELSSYSLWQNWKTVKYGLIELDDNILSLNKSGMHLQGTNGVKIDTANSQFTSLDLAGMLAIGKQGSSLNLGADGRVFLGGASYLTLTGGTKTSGTIAVKPYINVGVNDWPPNGVGGDIGANIYMQANGIWLSSAGETHIDPHGDLWFGQAHINTSTNSNSLWSGPAGGWWMRDYNGNETTIHCQSVSQSSLLSLKTNLNKLDGSNALSALVNTDIYSYNYKSDLKNGISKTYATPIIDDVNTKPKYNTPYDFISADGTGRDDGTILGYAVAAIKELNSKISSLEAELKQLKENAA